MRLSLRKADATKRYAGRVSRQCRVPAGVFRPDTQARLAKPAAGVASATAHVGPTDPRVSVLLPPIMAMFKQMVVTSEPFHLTLLNVAMCDFVNMRGTRLITEHTRPASSAGSRRRQGDGDVQRSFLKRSRPSRGGTAASTGGGSSSAGSGSSPGAEVPSPHTVDWGVFATLPREMQLELQRQWKRRRRR